MIQGGFSVTTNMEPVVKNMMQMLERMPPEILKDVATRTQISVKLRAPVYKGKLKESISLDVLGKNQMQITVGKGLKRPYAIYQEYGYTPHWVSKVKHPEVAELGKGKKAVFVRKSKRLTHGGYVEPTIQMIPQFIERAVDTYLKRLD